MEVSKMDKKIIQLYIKNLNKLKDSSAINYYYVPFNDILGNGYIVSKSIATLAKDIEDINAAITQLQGSVDIYQMQDHSVQSTSVDKNGKIINRKNSEIQDLKVIMENNKINFIKEQWAIYFDGKFYGLINKILATLTSWI